jgi:hypothetical protein
MDDNDLMRRALAAWFRSGAMDQPSNLSRCEWLDGRGYVVLRNVRGILAVYRVRADGMLRRLKRWPKVFD